MHCLICLNSNDKLQKFQSDMDNNTFKKITLVLPHLKIPKSKNPLFICAACLEQVSYFYTIKKASLENSCHLKHFKAMLKGTNISEFHNLNIKLYHDEILPEPKHHIEFKVNTNHGNLLSLEDQNSINIKEELEENYDLSQQLEKGDLSYNDLKVIKPSSSSNESIDNDLEVDMKLKDDIEFKVNLDNQNLASSENQNSTHVKEELEQNFVYNKQLEKDESSFNDLKVIKSSISSDDSSEDNSEIDMNMGSYDFVDMDKFTEKGEKHHEYDICQKTFNVKTHLLKHKQEHNLHPFQCSVCEKSFKLFNLLDRHQLLHTNEKPHKCEVCNKTYRFKPNLTKHMRCHDMGPYQCLECGKAFPRSIDLSVHMRTHNTSALKTYNRFHLSEKPFSCGYCEQSFSTISNLKEHKRRIHPSEESKDDELSVDCLEEDESSNDSSENDTVDMDVDSEKFVENKLTEKDSNLTSKNSRDEDQPETPSQNKRFKCTDCHKIFTCKRDLNRHSRFHTGDKPYKCITCLKTFTQLCDLNSHTLTHTGEKPHECDICHKTFRRKSHLIDHKRIHNNVRPYKCAVCNKEFKWSKNLITHMLIHTGEKPHHCHLCEYKCKRVDTLKVHIRSHTGEKPYSCKHCDKSFAITNTLKNMNLDIITTRIQIKF